MSESWTDVCAFDDLLADRGTAAFVHGTQVALFRLGDGKLFAIGNHDPVGGANVLARGLVGSRGDRPVVFSPLHKQAFDLATGVCLDADGMAIPTYPIRIRDGRVEVGPAHGPRPAAPVTAAFPRQPAAGKR
ncbi:nitrite reductase small subunit NirD [Protofrankia symbiont of Coriaria ruscifolia]|uniref:Rieske domain-containing protein n=1 Tax=Candidatus Protofrankia californiensis TaxID=1839754 RepID=A0A1C3NT17_9ACTN|nr:nitrite reductase small subunit NirD [Protofrankia symbiont of Coriaria ruscifolia]SBW17361.1 hypothetical protein FDG2_0182 [Candidatus Protofrankia californiensis]